MPELAKMLDGPAVSYGKGAMVGVNGEMEHGGACVHPMLGRPMRAAIGGGKAVIGSNVKVASAGASLDVPLGHKDDSWSFPHFDTITVSIADAPRPDEAENRLPGERSRAVGSYPSPPQISRRKCEAAHMAPEPGGIIDLDRLRAALGAPNCGGRHAESKFMG
jgi:hypothetical protein